jgi:uncharacterized protein
MEEARGALTSHGTVLGPSMDGGFYLLGVKRCPAGLLRDIEWSRPTTLEQTAARLKKQGLSVELLREWLDIDTVDDLSHMETLLAHRLVDCEHTQRALEYVRRLTVTVDKQ